MCVCTRLCAGPSAQHNSQRGGASPTAMSTPPPTLDLRTSKGGGTGVFRLYLRRYGSVGAETACACLRVCAPCTYHSRSASAPMPRPPARPHSSRGYPGTAPPPCGAVPGYPLLLPLPPKIPPKTWGKTPPLRVGAYALLKCPFMRIFRAYSRKIVQGGLGNNPPNLANIGRTI